jgi:hypothetical protein
MVSNGFAESLERPGGIYTGMDELPPGVTRKRLQLLKRAAPSISRVALLSTTPGRGGHETQLADAEGAARDLGFSVKVYRASSLGEMTAALDAIEAIDERTAEFPGRPSLANRQMIVDFATTHRLPLCISLCSSSSPEDSWRGRRISATNTVRVRALRTRFSKARSR